MKILVVDDHVLIREALRAVLAQFAAKATVLEACDGGEATRLVAQHSDLDLVLLDLSLPDRDGFSLLAELHGRHPAISIVALSASHDRSDVSRALALGAHGFIPKRTRPGIILSALQLIFSGGVYVPPESLDGEKRSAQPPAKSVAALPRNLTRRQLDVLAHMMQGRSNKSIARTLRLSEPTVKNHVTAILKALKASNRTEAVIAADKIGLKPHSFTAV